MRERVGNRWHIPSIQVYRNESVWPRRRRQGRPQSRGAPPKVFNIARVEVRGREVEGAALEGVEGEALFDPLVHPVKRGVRDAVCAARGR